MATTFRSLAASLLLAGSGFALGLSSAPMVSASAGSYLSALEVLGIHWWEGDGGDEKAVAKGLEVCGDLRDGRAQKDIINDLVWGDGDIAWQPHEAEIMAADARKIIGAATVHLCPDMP